MSDGINDCSSDEYRYKSDKRPVPSGTQDEREREIRSFELTDYLEMPNAYSVMMEHRDHLLSLLDAERKRVEEAEALAEFWEREVNNFRRNAAFCANQLAESKVKVAEERVQELEGALRKCGELANDANQCNVQEILSDIIAVAESLLNKEQTK